MLLLAAPRPANKTTIKSTMPNGVRCCFDEWRDIFFCIFFFTPSLFVEEVNLVYMIGNRLLDVSAKKSLKVKKVRKLRGFAEELVMIFCAFRM